MPIELAPHRPTSEEHEAGRKLGLPSDEAHAQLTMSVVEIGFDNGQYEECFALLKPLVRMRPDDARVYEAFGLVHQIQGEVGEARACFELAVELDETRAVSHLNLGELAWRKDKDAVKARDHLERAVKADPSLAKRAELARRQIDPK